ncbi:unnamed protein product [Phytophthora fragariaefolia]|uniref:Unnamed protein product n=1 Tax=Phytophthora fragariaefolia TaxID=1490495 RepID=A0A9W6XFG9_9STRA|nr:unnamed protein product [Phytophthora fragariaefolia]
MGCKIRWDDRMQDGIGHNQKAEPNLPWTSQAPSSSPGIANYTDPEYWIHGPPDPSRKPLDLGIIPRVV